jgi:DHA2 family multidrug resistance protein
MEVLDTTVANVALRYIAGGLSAAVIDSEWVITSYLAANAIILPISGWLAAHLGRRNYFLLSILIFTLSSAMCGFATSLGQLILFRVIQGLAGGGLQPSSQGVLLDAFPPEKQGSAMTIFGFAALLAPVVGPTLGGWLTDNYSWRWIFYINIPVGIFALVTAWMFVRDPEYITTQRNELRKHPLNFDYIGLILLSITMLCWEVVLSKGQEWDWFGDPFYRVQSLAAGFVIGLALLVRREMRIKAPVVNLRPLAGLNFRLCCIIIFCAFGVLYAQTTSLPGLLQSLFGYDAINSGLVMSPAGVGAVILMVVVGALIGRGIDARWLIAFGLLIVEISQRQVIWPRMVVIAGLSFIFAPINVAAYMYVPKEMRGAAVGLFSLLRNEGGSVGTSLAQTFQERREQFHLLRLNEYLDPLNHAVQNFFNNARPFYLSHTGDPAKTYQLTVQSLESVRQQQASSLAYFDVFWACAILSAILILPVFLMRRSVAEKGAHVAAE